jgi:hypothetical protein
MWSCLSLNEIGLKQNTDKSFYHKYMDFYEKILSNEDIKSVLEIWVWEGASIRTRREYFPEARIMGLDIVQCNPIEWCEIIKADATKQEFADTIDEIDFVIDDWSHWSDDQIAAFKLLRPKTKRIYIIEDVYQEMQRGNMWAIEFFRWFAKDNQLEYVEFTRTHGDNTFSMSIVLLRKKIYEKAIDKTD